MSKLAYCGRGSRLEPMCYDLTCSCGTLLGPLGRFRENPEGWRTVACPTCNDVTAVKGMEIRKLGPMKT